jgi:hypothetical protein
MFVALSTSVSCCDRLLQPILLSTLMLIGLVARTHASPPQAEYRAVANGVAEVTWLRQLLQELHAPLRRATVVFCDNISVVYMSSNLVRHQRTKHIEIDLHFVRERVAIGDLRVLHVPTSSQYADIFTKGLPSSVFTEFKSSLNVQSG